MAQLFSTPGLHTPIQNKFGLRVNDESMQPALPKGAIALVDTEAEILEGDIVAVKLKNGDQLIRRFNKINPELIQLISDNPNYEDKIITIDDIEVIFKSPEYFVNLREGIHQ